MDSKFRLGPTSSRPNNRGFTLVEMMVALAAGLIVAGATLAFFLSSMKSNGEYVQSTRLTQELRNNLEMITRDLRRAGYSDKSLGTIASGTASLLSRIYISGECVVYAYDRVNGTPGSPDQGNGEIRAFRRVPVTFQGSTVGVVQYAVSTATIHPDCAAAVTATNYVTYPPSCDTTTGWCPLSDPATANITALTITGGPVAAGSQISVREIGLALSGQLTGSTSFTRTVKSSVRIRSDCFIPTGFSCTSSP